MRLGGWVRLGIVASVLWVLGFGYSMYEYNSEQARTTAQSVLAICEINKEESKRPADYDCNKKYDAAVSDRMTQASKAFLLFTAISLAFFWGFAYLIVFVWRWVAKGFKRDPQ